MIVEQVLASAFAATVVLVALASILFVRRIRRHHRHTWEALGSPSVYRHHALSRRWNPLHDFIKSGGLAKLGDRYLLLLLRSMTVLGHAVWILLVLMVLARWLATRVS